MRIGLTGGIGSGKSEIARIFAECGAFVVDTDELAREAVAPQTEGLYEIARLWPQVVVNGALDRAALARIVFEDAGARERLNAIVHPQVRRLADERDRFAASGQLIVHVVPLLFETGYDRRVDACVLALAPDAIRMGRVMRRDGIDERQISARMAAQIDPVQARARADYVIENDGDLKTLRERTTALYRLLLTNPYPSS